MGLWDKLRGEGTGRYRRQLRDLINQERDSDRMYGDATLEAIRSGNAAQAAGYDQAIGQASDISRASRRDAITRSEELAGTLTARMGAGGKFGTTALDNARMGLSSALTRDLESIDSGFAGLFSELAIGKGAAAAEGADKLAAFQQARGEQESELYRLLTSTIRQPKEGMLGGLGAAAGAALGAFAGPQGAVLGGELGGAIGGALERN